jgi:lipid IVA palmitoyltransferase
MNSIKTAPLVSIFAIILTALLGQSAYSQSNGPSGSKYFSQKLSNKTCTEVIKTAANEGFNQTQYEQLDALIQALSVECGITFQDPDLNFSPVGFRFENSNLFILWDGQRISLNQQADVTLKYTMASGFNNIILVRKNDVDTHKENTLMGKILERLDIVKNNLKTVYENGETRLIIAGYAYHDRSTYTAQKLKDLNEKAWGIGLERTLVNERGNRESVYAMMFMDSHNDLEPTVGYEWQTPLRLTSGTKFWVGYSAGLTMRSDFSYVPVPFIFPTAGFSVGKLNIKAVLIPKLNGGINHGNVLFIFGSIPLN